MDQFDERLEQAVKLQNGGEFAELLRMLQGLFAAEDLSSTDPRQGFFMIMVQWRMLVEDYPPALAALAELRDEQIERLLSGDLYPGFPGEPGQVILPFGRETRISLIREMNDILDDPHSDRDLLRRLDADQPELARQYAWRLLPSVVEVGDYALADRYRSREPLLLQEALNDLARSFPLFPAGGAAPRLSAELSNLVREVRIGTETLRGLGREPEALALRQALIDGLDLDEIRMWAQRELDEKGILIREVVRRQMCEETGQ